MRTGHVLLAALTAVLLWTAPQPAWAPCDPGCPETPPGGVTLRDTPNFSFVRASPFRSVDKFVLGAGLGYAFPIEPMESGRWYVKAVPGVWSSRGEQDGYQVESKFKGWLLGGSTLYGINDNWGVNLTGIVERSTGGSAETVELFQGGPHSHVRLPGDTRGYIVGLGAVYDPVAGPRLRLPIIAGIGYNYYSATIEGSFPVSNPAGGEVFRYYGNHTVSRASLYYGLAPQADIGSLRFVPFIVGSDSGPFRGRGKSKVRLENLSSGASGEAELTYDEVTYLSAGLSVKYLPWDLSVSYIRGDIMSRGIDTDLFSLILDKRW